ncbi:MAG: tRNA (N6-isopentenyl adenosine(37)-C2)-methylthiotransferase MiaB [Eubacteriales bacterium]
MERKIITPEQLASQKNFTQLTRQYWQEMGHQPTAFVDTYGCQQNENDSERIRGMLEEAGYTMVGGPDRADVVVFNTCAIRENAEKRVYGDVGELSHTKKAYPNQKIFLCGCMMGQPHIVEKIKKSYRTVDGVFSTHHLWRFPSLLYKVLSTGERVFSVQDEEGSIVEGLPIRREGNLKAWVSIMFGCNNYCTYCIVPYVRGRERSRLPEDIIAEVKDLIAQGYKDITLLGQNVNSYGKDLENFIDFSDLLETLAQLDGEFLLRFMTSHPKDATIKLFDVMAKYPKIAKQLHLPVQSGNDRVLNAMNRRYTRESYLELVNYAKKVMPDVVMTSDIIVGFPGETEAEFEDTLSMIEQVEYDALFTFIFSPRKGTPAAELPDPFSKEEKSRWFDRLLVSQNNISQKLHGSYEGKTVTVLVDGKDGDQLTARTEGGRLVRLAGDDSLIGQFTKVTITGHTTWSLVSEE